MRRMLHCCLIVATVLLVAPAAARQPSADGWPAITREARPWTRWWWHGSAVDRASLTTELELLRAAGIGGVEITPIFGVRGAEDRFIPYLSAEWMAMLEHALREAGRLGLGVDMATGTGWPFGGPWVGDENAPRSIAHRIFAVDAGQQIAESLHLRQTPLVRRVRGAPIRVEQLANPIESNPNLQELALDQVKYPRDLPLAAVVAYGESGKVTDLMSRADAGGTLDWKAPERSTVYALFAGWHGKLVERAAPGGEGNVIDHFSRDAITRYLFRFDKAFAGRSLGTLRAFFNDSYEVDDAAGQGDWTPRLFEEFAKRRGYDLRLHLPALVGRASEEENTRVLVDYRETVSDLLLDTFTQEWGAWARRRGSVIRNQAHGSPANLLDLYAASDIPETEGTDIPRFKWATSAANVSGRRLISAEAATWLDEHFRSTLADVRSAVDHFFVAGVNHIVYHGTAYSPQDEPWPGWQFYASVEFNRHNAWWDDFPALNEYVARVQAFLQSGRPDHDVLLYFPFRDALAVRGKGLLTHFGGAERPTSAQAFEAIAAALQARGFTHDYISDRQLQKTAVKQQRLITGGGTAYGVLIVPSARFMPAATEERIRALERAGARILRLADASALEPMLARAGVTREPMVDSGMLFARRTRAAGRFYFINNRGAQAVDGWVPIDLRASAAAIFDPMRGRIGNARVRRSSSGPLEVYLQIPPGGSLIVAARQQPLGQTYDWHRTDGTPIAFDGPWQVQFLDGGPSLPAARTIERLASWTTFGGDDVKSFSGTAAYTTTFARPPGAAAAWQLDLGRVHDSARVRLNGRDLGTLIGPVFRLVLDARALAGKNVLEVRVTNLSANRIADLDRRGVPWKKFYNINFPARFPQNQGPDGLFSATNWPPLDSGLIGPVTLTPLSVAR